MAFARIQILSVRGGAVHRRPVDGGDRSSTRHLINGGQVRHDNVIRPRKLQKPLLAGQATLLGGISVSFLLLLKDNRNRLDSLCCSRFAALSRKASGRRKLRERVSVG